MTPLEEAYNLGVDGAVAAVYAVAARVQGTQALNAAGLVLLGECLATLKFTDLPSAPSPAREAAA